MSAPIIEHEIEPDPSDDPQHPIPYLKVLDVVAIQKSGGAKLSIVVASPLQSDKRSQTRLLDKIEGYLTHLYSQEFRSEAGVPTPENTTVTVVLHRDSAPEIYNLLERSKPWAISHNATLVIEHLDVNTH
jgi:hypothetical protein